MSKDTGAVATTSTLIQLFPIRLIPVDIGYKINDGLKKKILNLLCPTFSKPLVNVQLFGERALLSVNIEDTVSFYLFSDGIGVFVFEDNCVEIKDVLELDAANILTERRIVHRNLLNHTHKISKKMDNIVRLLRDVVNSKHRRQTANDNWEHGGFSYIMSFYFFNADLNNINNLDVQRWLGNMLFPDEHTYLGSVRSSFEQDKMAQILTSIDPLNDVHVCHSWATVIILGELSKERRHYYINLEIVLQHIWMFTYITEQNIDFFLVESNNKASSSQLTNFYNALVDMTLIVKRYDTVISSRVHERELKIFNALMESSKLEILKKGVDAKSNVLESKLSWAIEQKRLKSDRNVELFIILLTILQVLSGFGLGINDISQPLIWILLIASIFVLLIYRMRD